MSHSSLATSFLSCNNCGNDYVVDDVRYPSLPKHLRKTNTPPSQSELSYLKALVIRADLEQEIAVTDQEIRALKHTLDALRRRRRKMDRHFRACKSIRSSYRHLPTELIIEIIRWATETDTAKREAVTLNTKHGIWAYSQVCQRWRTAALSTPSFWSTISIEFDPELKRPSCLPCVGRILSRTRNHALSLNFACGSDTVTYEEDRTLKEFMKHARQWREVLLRLPGYSLTDLQLVKDRVPNLESISLELIDWNHLFIIADTQNNYFKNAPALRKLTLCPSVMWKGHFQLPWSQIIEYRVPFADADVMPALRLMPNLQSLELNVSEDHLEEVSNPLELRHLCRLQVRGCHSLVSALTLPALRELSICVGELEQMTDLTERSECRIITLKLNHCSGDHELDLGNLLHLLQAIPTVSTLDLSQEGDNIGQLCKLLIKHDHLLPILSEVILPPMSFLTDACNGALITLLRQRRRAQSKPTQAACMIERVVFARVAPVQPLSPEMQSLQCDGLHISFRSTVKSVYDPILSYRESRSDGRYAFTKNSGSFNHCTIL